MESNYSESLVEKILFEPVYTGANRLCIMAEYATPNMASWLLKTYDERKIGQVSVELVVTSSIDAGIDYILHEGFKELRKKYSSASNSRFTCSYLHQLPKLKENYFIWLNDEHPLRAFSCSYNFTQSSMLRTLRGYVNVCQAVNAYEIYENMLNQTIYCNHLEVEEYVVIKPNNVSLSSENGIPSESCVLSFLTRTGEPGTKSGLNWGQRNKRNRNEAYIPLPSKIAKSGFFPLNKQHFLAITDDHHTLQLRVEQQNNKAITTPASNAQLGEYFRNRLGLANGAYVHAHDLILYGRTDVTFYKIDDEQYFMDFSVAAGGESIG